MTASRFCFLIVAALAGCTEKPSTQSPAAEIRGEPIRPVAAQATTPSAGGVAPATSTFSAANSKLETQNSKPAEGAAYPLVGFDKLSGYPIEISDEMLGPVTNDLAAITAKTEALIPKTVKVFDQKRASIKGFMLPLKVEGGLVTELLIMKDQSMCCYGTAPKIHEWVSVKMAGKGVKPLMDQPVTLFGTLHIGEMRENGYLVGLYRMDGERMQAPEEN